MITLEALMRDYPEFPQLKWLSIFNWYDGPICGICEVQVENDEEQPTRSVWAEMHPESDMDDRIYQIKAPSGDSWTQLIRRKELFSKYVSTQWDMEVPEAERKTYPYESWKGYFSEFPADQPLTVVGLTVGWFRG